MSKWPSSIARKAIRDFAAYSARGGAGDAIHLDANESPWPPPPADASVTGFNRYPEQQPSDLRNRLAGLYGVNSENIMMGRGADESIEVLLRTFCEAREDSVLICPPTFGFFTTAAQIQGAKIERAPLKADFSWDPDLIAEKIKSAGPKIIFLCSPNNPTGNSLSIDVISKLCAVDTNALVVVDEAYIEFSDNDSVAPQIGRIKNLVVLRTLSKAYALSGVRMGVCLAHKDVIALMLKVLPPYPVPVPVKNAVLRALAPSSMAILSKRIEIWKSERARLMKSLPNSSMIETVYPSDANFILFKTCKADALLKTLAKSNVKIRDFRPKISSHFRISIGSPEENDILLDALGVETVEKPAERVGECYRKTKETDIAIRVNLDESSDCSVDTGIGFFDHMLEALSKHSNIGLVLTCKGDLEIDPHHSVEDTALALGTALKQALGNRAGIGRYGFVMPMDETQARVAIDLSGRPAFVFNGQFPTDHVGEFPVEMCPHFFESLAQTLGASIQIEVEGDNSHHIIEACFKGVARALRPAFSKSGSDIPSTKGVL